MKFAFWFLRSMNSSKALSGLLLNFFIISSVFCELNKAQGYFLKGDWKRAVEEFYAEGVQNLSPESLNKLALSLYYLGRYEEAKRLLKPFIDKDLPSRLVYYLVIATKDKDIALKELSQISTVEALISQAIIIMNKEPEKALALLNEVIKKDPDNFWAWFYRGVILESREEFMEASKAYKNAIRLNPFFAQAHNNLGYCYKEMHYYSYAVEEYLKAIELMPDNAGYYYNLGNAYTHLERIEDAFNAYKKAVELDPKFAKAHYNLARTYLRKDMVREAIEEFRLYIKYGNKEIFNFVAPKEAVLEEIEQLEEYLKLYGPVEGR
jgi:tetratricopeptide (TPR) repeat protein